MRIETYNPATEELLNTYSQLDNDQIDCLITHAQNRYVTWKKTSLSERAHLMLQLARLLKEKQDEYALLMALEMGKPVSAGKAEINKCAWVCEHYAQNAEDYLAPRIIKTEMQQSQVCYEPLGIIFAVMPWNFPFWQVLRFAIPTIMAGNVAILKHASISAGAGDAIAALFLEAGFPEHVFQHALINKEHVGGIIAHKHIAAVTLTGSEQAGRDVASHAAVNLKKVVLELGGSDPYIVLADADLDLAAQCIVDSRLNNCGQVCIAAKRVIVVNDIVDELIKKIIVNMNRYKMGDPLNPQTNLGPMARADLRLTLQKQVEISIDSGAILHLGGVIPNGRGYFYPPTLITHVSPGMPAFDEELFGPVVAIVNAQDEQEAICLANQSRYGLGAAVFTKNLERGWDIAKHEIEAGVCFVNALVASDPRLPFGGIKQSGFGRELSKEGILEFVNIKTIALHGS